MNTTKRYIHPNESHIREAMAKVWGGHSFGHSDKKGDPKAASDLSVTDSIDKDLTGATRRDRTGDLLITKPPLSSPICSYFSHSGTLFGQFGPSARLLTTGENV